MDGTKKQGWAVKVVQTDPVVKRPYAWWAGVSIILLLALFGFFGVIIIQLNLAAQGHQFSAFETTAFSVAQLMFSFVLSGFFSWFLTTIGAQAAHRDFARAAIRNIEDIKEEATRLRHIIKERKGKVLTGNDEQVLKAVIIEYFDHFDSLAEVIENHAASSIEDWVDLAGIPAEEAAIVKRIQQEKRLVEEALDQAEAQLAEVQQKNSEEKEALVADYEARIDDLKRRLKDLKGFESSIKNASAWRYSLMDAIKEPDWTNLRALEVRRTLDEIFGRSAKTPNQGGKEE